MFYVFCPTASATAYGCRPKFVDADGENCAYSPTLGKACMCFKTRRVRTGNFTVDIFLVEFSFKTNLTPLCNSGSWASGGPETRSGCRLSNNEIVESTKWTWRRTFTAIAPFFRREPNVLLVKMGLLFFFQTCT